MLYWAEGKKSINTCRLGNTDPDLLKFFTRFLTGTLNVSKNRISIRCSHHGELDDKVVEGFWLDHLKLTKDSLRKTTKYTKRDSKKKNRHLHGLCEVSVHDVEVVQRIYGAIKSYAGIVDNKWID